MGPPGAFGLLSRAYEAKYGLDYRMLGKLAVTQRNHAHHERERLRKAARADHHRRLHQLAHDRRSDPAARLRDAGPTAAAGLIMMSRKKRAKEKGPSKKHHPDRLCRADQLPRRREPGRRDQERPRDLPARRRSAQPPARASRTLRSFHPYDDFIIAHHAAVRGVRLLQAGRRHAVRPRHRLLLQRRPCRSTPAAARFRRARRPARRTT